MYKLNFERILGKFEKKMTFLGAIQWIHMIISVSTTETMKLSEYLTSIPNHHERVASDELTPHPRWSLDQALISNFYYMALKDQVWWHLSQCFFNFLCK